MSAEDFDREVKKQIKRAPKIRADTVGEILRLLRDAQTEVVAALGQATSDAARLRLGQQQAAIADAIARFDAAARQAAAGGVERAWQAGVELVTEPLRASRMALSSEIRIDDRALRALQNLTTDKIKDITRQALEKINAQIAQVVIGTRTPAQAIAEVQRVLGKGSLVRARAIVYTSVGQAYSESSFESLQQAQARGARVAKSWLRSAKQRPRATHVAAHNQTVRIADPFMIPRKQGLAPEPLRFPRDPKASLGNVLQCGCFMRPVTHGSTIGNKVVSIPVDATQPLRFVSRAEFDRENTAASADVADRLRRFMGNPPA